MYTFVVETV